MMMSDMLRVEMRATKGDRFKFWFDHIPSTQLTTHISTLLRYAKGYDTDIKWGHL